MTLSDFRRETADMPGSTELKVLSPWGEIEDSAFVTIEDLEPDDPVRQSMDPTFLLITSEAN